MLIEEKYKKKNNFDKIKDIESLLMVGDDRSTDVYISFFIPTFNRTEALIETIHSILNLNQLDTIRYEIIITDNSANFTKENDTCQFLKNLNHTNIKYYINKKNVGHFNNWNRGIELSNGKYFVMVHDDDLLHENYLIEMKKCLDVANRIGNLGFIHVQKAIFNTVKNLPSVKQKSRGGLIKYRFSDSLIDGVGPTCAPTCGTLFVKELLIDIGGYDDDFYPSSDHLIGSLLIENGYNGYLTEDCLGYYRVGLNETLNPDTIKKIVEMDYYISNCYIYQVSLLTKIFGSFFSNIQYSARVDLWVKLSQNKYKVNLNINDLDFKKTYQTYKFRKLMLRCMSSLKHYSKIIIHD